MNRFRNLPPSKMNLPELEEELNYQTKRLYRLRKLQKRGVDVGQELEIVDQREAALDLEVRDRREGMAEIPF